MPRCARSSPADPRYRGPDRALGRAIGLDRSTVADAAVTDTHPLLFHAAGSHRLGRRAAAVFEAAERQAAIIYVPAAVIWECGLLSWVGRVDLRRPLVEFFADLFSNPAYQPLDLTPDQIFQADAARPNRDPFDALICAAARRLDLPLLTRDKEIQDSGLVSVIW
jgi:PIN domain nuclease of toxin-antitoxin system